MRPFNADALRDILADQTPPCVSLYQPTSRSMPDKHQNSVRFSNLLRQAEEALKARISAAEARALLQPFWALEQNADFWNHARDGIAALAAPGLFEVFRLQGRIPERLVVADSFHVKPLLRAVQGTGRYQVLCVSRRQVKLYEGDRDTLDEVPLEDIPGRVPEIRNEEVTTETKAVDPFANELGDPFTPEGHAAVYQSGGNTGDTTAVADRFFRAVDLMILDKHSRPSGLPLVLAALPEHHAEFRRASHNPYLANGGIEINPFALSHDDIRQRAWAILEPQFTARLAKQVEDYGAARSRGLGTDNLAEAAEAAISGRIATLLIEDGRQAPGRIDPTSGRVVTGDAGGAGVDDLYDDLAELVLKMGGQVTVLAGGQMPTTTGLAATYRY